MVPSSSQYKVEMRRTCCGVRCSVSRAKVAARSAGDGRKLQRPVFMRLRMASWTIRPGAAKSNAASVKTSSRWV